MLAPRTTVVVPGVADPLRDVPAAAKIIARHDVQHTLGAFGNLYRATIGANAPPPALPRSWLTNKPGEHDSSLTGSPDHH